MQLPKPRTIFLTLFTAVALGLTGCVADPEVADVLPDQGAVPTHVAEVTFPDTEVATVSKWVVEEINAVRAMNKQDWYSKVSPELTEDIPVDSLVGTLNADLRPSLPFVASHYEEPEQNYGITRLTPDLTSQPVDLHIQVDQTGLISALWYETVETDATTDQPETPTETMDEETEAPSSGLGD